MTLLRYYFLSLLLLVPIFEPARADVPPNPTGSSITRDTAGGDSTLKFNSGYDNTGFGYRTLSSPKSPHNTAFGSFSLTKNDSGHHNSAVGSHSLYTNQTGYENTAIGSGALYSNTTGNENTGLGYLSLYYNQSGNFNTAIGSKVLKFNLSSNNTAVGHQALHNNKTGSNNNVIGVDALISNNAGSDNTAIGVKALSNNIIGKQNIAIGNNALEQVILDGNVGIGNNSLQNLSSGMLNIALGNEAGKNLFFGNANIYIGNKGDVFDFNTIRIGSSSQNRIYIESIRKGTVGNGDVPVLIDSSGRLGIAKSSARFKEDIADMNEASAKLMQLRPVTYRYKEADANGTNPLEYGLIAEEVAKVYPDLVAYGADGQIETVQYQKLTPMLLNELQHTNALIRQQSAEIKQLKTKIGLLETQAQRIEALTTRLSKIEAQQTVGLLK